MPQVIQTAVSVIKVGLETVGVPAKFAQMGAEFIVRDVIPNLILYQTSRLQEPTTLHATAWRSEEPLG